MREDVGQQLVSAVRARDFDALAACFAAGARVRILTPRSLRELEGPEAAADRFRAWFGDADGFELLDAEVTPVADRLRIRWHTRGRNPDKGWQENDHTGYAEVEKGKIVTLNVSCAGFRPASAPPGGRSRPDPPPAHGVGAW
ncbi:MAG TPA: nuclear transport factor 2 family protein [Gaiellaceae bacterium]|nr:nuclear transport factor 2 family protein [Gaiellaceae bacterium]